jgi:gliding motility-associated protein GldC
MRNSTITISVQLDDNHPVDIQWKATDSNVADAQQAKAMMVAFWDGEKKSALNIDLWTREMTVDEMAEFCYQTQMTMAETFSRATSQTQFADQMKRSAREFQTRYAEFRNKQSGGKSRS